MSEDAKIPGEPDAEAIRRRQKDEQLLEKSRKILSLPKEQIPTAAIKAEQAADIEHSAKADEAKRRAEEDAKIQAALDSARAEAVEQLGKSKEAFMARIKARHASFKHDVSTDPETGDMVLHSYVLFGEGERARRVAVAQRIPHADHSASSFSADDLVAIECEQLHVLAQRLGC